MYNKKQLIEIGHKDSYYYIPILVEYGRQPYPKGMLALCEIDPTKVLIDRNAPKNLLNLEGKLEFEVHVGNAFGFQRKLVISKAAKGVIHEALTEINEHPIRDPDSLLRSLGM